MTFGLLALAAVLALSGTSLTAPAFVAVAVSAWLGGGTGSAAVVWTSTTAAALVVLGSPARRLALPAVGVAAALVAARSDNAAAVLPAWILASSCAVAAAVWAGDREQAAPRRWALALLLCDIPLAAAVGWSIAAHGFSLWGTRLDAGPALLLLAAALARCPLGGAAGVPGLVVVRAQSLLLVAMVLAGRPGAPVRIVLAAGAVAVGAAGLLGSAGRRDAVQEAGLFAICTAMVSLGALSRGWPAAALAAGTIVHLVRVGVPRIQDRWSPIAQAVLGGGFSGPLFAVGGLAIGGLVSRESLLGIGVALALLTGLAGRFWGPTPGAPAGGADRRLPGLAVAGLGAGIAGSLAVAPASALPVTLTVVLAAAAVGWRLSDRFAPVQAPQRPEEPLATLSARIASLGAPAGGRRVVLTGTAILAAAAMAIWLVGLRRGFL